MKKKTEQDSPIRWLSVYRSLLLRHPMAFLIIALLYLVASLAMVRNVSIIDVIRAPFDAPELRRRVRSLEATVVEKDTVISRLGQGKEIAPLFRDLTFDEAWRSDETRVSISRLLEYAEFAISKGDFRHAQRLYEEASQIQDTIAANYHQGRLAYIQGDLKRTVDSWMAAATLDTDRNYPILRLYVGIVLLELGDEAGANRFIKEYTEAL